MHHEDNKICALSGEPDSLIRKVNKLHKKLEFTMVMTDKGDNLSTLGINCKCK